MTTDRQSMVPDGLPHGERKKTVAAMEQAGVPLSPTQSPAGGAAGSGQRARLGPPPPAGGPAGGLDLLGQTTPGDFPWLTDVDNQTPEAQPSSEPDSQLEALAASAQSSFGAAVLSRLTANRR